MGDGSERQALGGSLRVFALALIAGGAIAVALGWAMPGLPLPGGLGIVILPAAALLAGRGFARRAGRLPTGTEMASFTVAATVFAVVFAVVATWGLLSGLGRAMTAEDFAVAILRLPASPEMLWRWPLFWAELAPWVALLLAWTGFSRGARWGLPAAARTEAAAR